LAFLGSAAALAGLVGVLLWSPRTLDKGPVVVYCAAAERGPVEAAAKEYEKEYGVPIHLTYGGSETLLSKVALDKRGDLYIPADDSYLEKGRAKGLLDEDIPLARMTAVIAVRKGNPKKIAKLSDLLRKDVRLALANPDAAAVGSVLRQKLDAGTWQA